MAFPEPPLDTADLLADRPEAAAVHAAAAGDWSRAGRAWLLAAERAAGRYAAADAERLITRALDVAQAANDVELSARAYVARGRAPDVLAARHIRDAIPSDGTWLIVEPAAQDTVAGNLNPVGRVYYSFSTFLCVPNALSQTGGYALGAQAGEAAIRRVATEAGFTRFRRAAETPFNLVFEARP